MYSFDASSMIHAWDNYPLKNPHFNSLWDWFSEQIITKKFTISETAFGQVNHKIPECGAWLTNNNIVVHRLTATSLTTAQTIKTLLGIYEDNQYNKGVDEKDLLIISSAKENKAILVNEEGRQNKLPEKKSNYKIPAVCHMPKVSVECVNFLDLLTKD